MTKQFPRMQWRNKRKEISKIGMKIKPLSQIIALLKYCQLRG